MRSSIKDRRSLTSLASSAWFWGGLAFVVILILEFVKIFWFGILSRQEWFILDGMVIVLVLVLASLAFRRLASVDQGYLELEKKIKRLEEHEKQHYQQIARLIQANQLFTDAEEEQEVFVTLLRLAQELVGAEGASFVPLDERGQPLTAVRHGELPEQVTNAWLEYLASPAVRNQCQSCRNLEKLMTICPLLHGPALEAASIYCVNLKRGEKDFGILNLYLPENEIVAAETQSLLRAVIDEAIMSLESIRLRKKELLTLHQLETVRQKTDLQSLYNQVLENIWESMDVDFAMVIIWNSDQPDITEAITKGELPAQLYPLVDGVLAGVKSSSEPVIMQSMDEHSEHGSKNRTLLAVPVGISRQEVWGAILVTHQRSRLSMRRQLPILKSMANQVALVIHNVNKLGELQYRVMLDERTRLAREFHDGLAQTLGFLKLKMAQVINYRQNNEAEKIDQSLPLIYDTLSEAYLDARQAIDDLRLSSREAGLLEIVGQMVDDFREKSNLDLILELPEPEPELPPEYSSQVLRIIQEAMNNVRKHAKASHASLSIQTAGSELVLCIEDDGAGFNPDDISAEIQHGLKGMQERSDLIGADLQVESQPGQGTRIRLVMPLIERQAA